MDAGYEDYPYLFIGDIHSAVEKPTDIFEFGVCVEGCPATSEESKTSLKCKTTNEVRSCAMTDVNSYGSRSIFSYCVPETDTLSEDVKGHWSDLEARMMELMGGDSARDLYNGRYVVVGSFGIALIIVLAYVWMMDKLAVYIAWISVVMIEVSLVVGGVAWWWGSIQIKKDNDDGNDGMAKWYMTAAVITWVFAGLFCLMMACNFKSLRVSIAIIETAADWFADTKRILLIPFMYFIIGVLLTAGWVGCMIQVWSIGTIEVEDVATQSKHVEWDSQTRYMAYYMIFGLFWIIAFMMAANEFSVIVSTCTWYFSRKDIPDDDGIPGDSDVGKGLWWTWRYHTGTIAFGSLLIAIVWTVRAIFEYIGNKVAQATGDNCAVKALLCCVRCCLDCFDRFMRFINQNAYIYCALSNESFCSSALNAFILVLKNMAKFSFVNAIGGTFMFIAKICIACFTAVICYFILNWMDSVEKVWYPVICTFVVGYIMGSIFISVFDASSNTILQCYLVDMDIARQTGIDSKHVPPTLAEFLLKHNK